MRHITLVLLLFFQFGLFAQPFSTESQWTSYFKKNIQELDPIEGIWSNTNTQKIYDNYNRLIKSKYNPQVVKAAICKSGNMYKVYYLASNDYSSYMSFINSKLTIAENASYAVKASYLSNLIELLDNPPKLPTVNTLQGRSLSAQVQIIKKFVYIIETE